ncbi:MAG: alpha/beta hydrolase [Bacteroidaceae bacterium]|nr:alpha/beta hydrolase [Bacteroidaceae bacterium]
MILAIAANAKKLKLEAFIPEHNPTGTAVIVCPGGSYFWLDYATEGRDVARWLNENGIAAFVLKYSHGGWAAFAFHVRVPGRSYPAGHNDLKDAIEHVRSNAEKYNIRTDRIGCMGFSAGGHLVMQAAEMLAGTPLSPSFVAPMYPVVSMTHPCTHKRSVRGLLGESPKEEQKQAMSLEHHVPDNCPPVFLVNCKDDPIVDYRNSELLDSALTVHNIRHKYIQYKTGGHGFGATPSKTTKEAIQWKESFLEWLKVGSIN